MKAKVLLSAIYLRFNSLIETCDFSNISVNISSENSCDIRFKSQLRRVNPSQWIRPVCCLKAAFFRPSV
jgi:hypothetical protein